MLACPAVQTAWRVFSLLSPQRQIGMDGPQALCPSAVTDTLISIYMIEPEIRDYVFEAVLCLDRAFVQRCRSQSGEKEESEDGDPERGSEVERG